MSKQPPLDDRCSPWPWSQVATMSSDFTFIRREGPQLITAGEHWDNIMSYPTAYQLDEPRTIVQYED